MKITDITPAAAIDAVFHIHVNAGGYSYLLTDEFEDEDPDEVRREFADAIEYTLAELGVPSNAENCGDAGDIVLEHLPYLAAFFDETSDR